MQLADIAKLTAYRTVLYTGKIQITHSHLMPAEYIPEERHDTDQIVQILSGTALISINGFNQYFIPGSIIPIKAGKLHLIRPMIGQHVSLLSTYGRPLHPNDEVVERGPVY